MTNEEAKQEAIKAAFADKWDLFHSEYKLHLLTKKHWVDQSIEYSAMDGVNLYKQPSPKSLGFEPQQIETRSEFWRPIQLKGIEDNNGWTRIEPDLSNLPEKGILHRWLTLNKNIEILKLTGDNKGDKFLIETHTHYKPIEILPIY